MYTGNPHQDRNPFATKWRDRINTDSRPPFHGGGAIPLPKDTMPREPWMGRFGPLAELTQKQKDYMGNELHTPAFGVKKEDLFNRVKGMEKKGFFGIGAQEPTTEQEFNDYYKQLGQGEVGNWQLAMNRGLDNWGGNLGGTFNQEGYGDPGYGGRFGQDEYYDYDDYYPDILDPGMDGPLNFG